MADMFSQFVVFSTPFLAQEAAAPPVAGDGGATIQPGATGADPGLGPAGGTQQPASPFGGGFFMIMLLFLVVMLVLPAMAGRKQKKQRAQMLSSIARHDRVQTVGGMIGTVAEIRDDEIVLKVDESTNTKIRFSRSAVQTVLKKAGDKTDVAPVETPEMANA